MATQITTELGALRMKNVNLTDLDDKLMKLWLSKLSVTEQTAATRVCKKFDDNAYKLTTVMYANELPEKVRNKIISRMPKLKKICWIVCQLDEFLSPQMDAMTKAFLESAAKINPNIERFINLPEPYNYHFVMKCLEHHKGYDGSKFKGLLRELDYNKLLMAHPNVKVRHRIFDLANHPNVGSKTRSERLSSPYLSALDLFTVSGNYDFRNTLTMTKHLTDLSFNIQSVTAKPDYSKIFNSVAKLPLKKFELKMEAAVPGKVYGWVKRDIDSFKALLQVASLVDVSLWMPMGHPTYLITLKCFLDCPRNNFHHFSSFSGYDMDVSPFYPIYIRSQLYPSMYLSLQKDGKVNDSFPMAEFIQKFSPKYREFMFEGNPTMVKMIHSCLDLIKNHPKIHFVFYQFGSNFPLKTFRPIQLGTESIKFSAELSFKQYINVYSKGHEYPKIDRRLLEFPIEVLKRVNKN